jgi:hypothetical protein
MMMEKSIKSSKSSPFSGNHDCTQKANFSYSLAKSPWPVPGRRTRESRHRSIQTEQADRISFKYSGLWLFQRFQNLTFSIILKNESDYHELCDIE